MVKKGKRLCAKITVGGKAVFVYAYSKAELERKKVETREHLRDGIDMKRDVPFVELIRDWWENDRKPRIKAKNTLKNYLNTLNNHLLPVLDQRQMARAVTRTDLQRCIDAQAGKASCTVDLCIAILRHTCEYAVADGRLLRNPADVLVRPDVKEHKERGALTVNQVDKLMDVAEASGHDGLMIYLLYFLGLRRGEMLGLKWGDFDWNSGMVSIERQVVFSTKAGEPNMLEGIKTKNGYRRVPIPEQLEEILMPYRQMPGMLLFSSGNNEPISFRDFNVVWHAMMQAAGFAHLKKRSADENEARAKKGKAPLKNRQLYDYDITPHWFRHNYISMMYDAGVPAETACRLAGHARYSTTVDTYTHIKDERLKAEAVKLDGMFTRKVVKRLSPAEKQAR